MGQVESCGYLNDEQIQKITSLSGTFLEPFAGIGYFAKKLRKSGKTVRASDIDPHHWDTETEVNTTVEQEDARDAVRRGNEQVLVFMFPPPNSDVPAEVLKLAMKRGGFTHLVVIQECLESYHCGDDEYVELLEQFNLVDTGLYESHPSDRRFTSGLWIGTFPTE